MARERHGSDVAYPGEAAPLARAWTDAGFRFQDAYAYFDGLGRTVVQKKRFADAPGGGERWATTGFTVYDNKERPIRQYEPFFTSTSDFEPESDIVAVGVSPELYYDPLGRVVRTVFPDGSTARFEFDGWQQVAYDQADTACEEGSVWLGQTASSSPSGLGADPAANRTAWCNHLYTKRDSDLTADQDDRAAYWTAVLSGTPTVTKLDTLGRPFAVTATQVAPDFATNPRDWATASETETTTLDITGNALTLTDARDVECFAYTYDLVGRRLRSAGVDDGLKWTLPDGAGRPLLSWRGDADVTGDHDFRFREEYDPLGRPVTTWLQVDGDVDGSGARIERAQAHTVYGELLATPKATNHLGQVYQSYDSAGLVQVPGYDYRGTPTSSERTLAAFVENAAAADVLEQDPDWSAVALASKPAAKYAAAALSLESETWAASASVDALGRPYRSVSPTEDPGDRTPSVTLPGYDLGGLLAAIDVEHRGTPVSAYVKDIQYNARGQRTSVSYGSGVATTYTYDPKTFRVTRIRSVSGTDVLQDLNYTYGPAGQIYACEDGAQDTIFFNNAVVRPVQQFVYDGRYRLAKAIGRELKVSPYGLDQEAIQAPQTAIPSSTTDMVAYTRVYEWDAAGNMAGLSHTQAATSPVNWSQVMAYAKDSNRLLSVTHGSSPAESIAYDQHGQMTGLPVVRQMHWDATGNLRLSQNQAASTERTWYVYAGVQRVRKVTETWDSSASQWSRSKETLYLGGFEVYRTYTAAGVVDYERESLHVTDGDNRVAEVQAETEGGSSVLVRYSLANPTMSVTVQTDATGAVIWYEEFRPFGSSAYVASTGALASGANRYRYQGKEKDEETGLSYYGYRYYAPWVMRWTCADPGGTIDGINLFGFVGGNAVGKRDVDGRLPDDTPEATDDSTSERVSTGRYESAEIEAMIGSSLYNRLLDLRALSRAMAEMTRVVITEDSAAVRRNFVGVDSFHLRLPEETINHFFDFRRRDTGQIDTVVEEITHAATVADLQSGELTERWSDWVAFYGGRRVIDPYGESTDSLLLSSSDNPSSSSGAGRFVSELIGEYAGAVAGVRAEATDNLLRVVEGGVAVVNEIARNHIQDKVDEYYELLEAENPGVFGYVFGNGGQQHRLVPTEFAPGVREYVLDEILGGTTRDLSSSRDLMRLVDEVNTRLEDGVSPIDIRPPTERR